MNDRLVFVIRENGWAYIVGLNEDLLASFCLDMQLKTSAEEGTYVLSPAGVSSVTKLTMLLTTGPVSCQPSTPAGP